MNIDVQGLIFAAALAAFFAAMAYVFRKKRETRVIFSASSLFLEKGRSFKERFARLPDYLMLCALAAFFLALINPQIMVKSDRTPEESGSRGLAMFLLLDSSTSMHYTVLAGGVETEKIDLSKRVAKQFVLGDKNLGLSGRKGDAIGLVTFARIARVISPLTLDHQKIVEEIDKIQFNRDIKQIGSGIGYAIYKTVSTLKATSHFGEKTGENPNYELKNPILIIVTDGINEVNDDDKDDPLRGMDIWKAAEYAKENNVKVYLINIDPSFAKAADKTYMDLYKLITEYTGGHFYAVDDAKDFVGIYRDIDKIEKSKIPLFVTGDEDLSLYDKKSLFPYFLSLGVFLICLSVVLEAFYFRRVP